MFAESVVEKKLDLFEAEFGWRPRPHTIEEVDAWSKQLETAFEVDKNGNVFQIRELTKNEAKFVANERGMVAASCGYFLTRYYWIKAKSRILRFAFRQGQWILWRMLQELDEMGVSKMIQVLKARQLGISTMIEGIMTWGALFIPGNASQIGSSDGQKTQIMLGMMTLAIEQLPPWLPPKKTRAKTASDRGLIEFSHIGSLIMVQPGSMMGGMGQGATPTMVHLSEVSQFTNPVQQLDEGLFKALHEDPQLVVILESTGDAGHRSAWWWREQWITNRDNYWKGDSDFLPVFLPWHTTPELYPGPWLKKHPLPEGFTPNADTISHVKRCEAYVRNTEMLRRVMGADWTMPIEQQWFWQYKYEDHKRRRVEKSWNRQMPGDDYEALLGINDKVLSQDAVDQVESGVMKLGTYGVYMLVGDGVPSKHEPEEANVWYGDDAPPRLKFDWKDNNKNTLDWMLVPMRPVPEKQFEPLGKVLIFEEPMPGYDYSASLDTGTGVGGDRSVVNVTRHGTDEFPDEQVAEFASDSIGSADIYAWLCALTAYYSKFMTDKPHPKIIIETVRKYGDLPIHQCRMLGFRRQHEWGQGFDRKTFKEKVGKHGAWGWRTNVWSRPLITSAFQSAVENGWYIVRSKWLSDELKDVEQKTMASGKTRMDHASGKHDDRAWGAYMAYWTLHQSDVMALRSQKRFEKPKESGIVVEYGPATMQLHIVGGKLWDRKAS